MSRELTANDRKSLIRLASELPKGSPERRAILAGLKQAGVDEIPKRNRTDFVKAMDIGDAVYNDLRKVLPRGMTTRSLRDLTKAGWDFAFRAWKPKHLVNRVDVEKGMEVDPETEARLSQVASKYRLNLTRDFAGNFLLTLK